MGRLSTRARVVLLAVALVLAGGVLTWLAFGVGVQKVPADPTNGVELVPAQDRTSR